MKLRATVSIYDEIKFFFKHLKWWFVVFYMSISKIRKKITPISVKSSFWQWIPCDLMFFLYWSIFSWKSRKAENKTVELLKITRIKKNQNYPLHYWSRWCAIFFGNAIVLQAHTANDDNVPQAAGSAAIYPLLAYVKWFLMCVICVWTHHHHHHQEFNMQFICCCCVFFL